jgi:hypothetical protein
MQRIFLLLLVLVCATVSAQVYKRIGPDGKVYFSDQPGPDAEQVEVSPAQAISLPPVPEQTGAAQQQRDVVVSYSVFTIVSPTSDQGVRANDGNVTVSLSLRPELMPGHTVMLDVDGEDGEQIKTGDGLTIDLSNLSRGLHTVEARVVDAQGKALIQAGPVSFNVLRVAAGGR